MNLFKGKKLYNYILVVALTLAGGLAVSNLDMLLRFYHSSQDGTLTVEKIRLDLASFNFGKKSSVMPINTRISPLDGMLQVYVPEGEFLMGKGEVRKNADSPEHMVYLDAYWVDKYEVSNAMYLKCIKAGGCTDLVSENLYYQNWIYRNHPVTFVTWDQAISYCDWAGRKLPSEAEWEKAARGTDGRAYPWGDETPSPRLANFTGSMIHESVSIYRYPLGASPYGALNMSGNAREWVADWYDGDYYLITPYSNPTGPESGTEHSLRSGSYNEDKNEIIVTNRYRHEPQSAGLSRGFRCAQDAGLENKQD